MAKFSKHDIFYHWVCLRWFWEDRCARWRDRRAHARWRKAHHWPQNEDDQPWPECGSCGDSLRELDSSGASTTYTCLRCGECYLCIDQPEMARLIWLPHFLRKRGDGSQQRPLSDLRMATRLVECLALDSWPSAATVVDFGIDSPSHLGALQHAVRRGISAYDLDRVMGSGPAITWLIRAVPGQPYADVRFQTAYDDLPVEEDEDL